MFDFSDVESEGFGKYLAEAPARNQEAQVEMAQAGLDSYGKLLQAKEMAKAYKAQARRSSGGGGIFGTLAGIGSSFLGPIAGAFGGSIAKGLFPK